MTARRELPPPIRQDLRHQHASHARLAHDRDAAERHAWVQRPQPVQARSRRPAAPEKT